MTSLNLFGNQMRDNLGIGLALERPSARGQFIAQLLEILDNAIVDQRDFARRMRMRVACGRRAVGGPAGMRDTDIARRIVGFQDRNKVRKLALGAPTDELAIMHGAHPRAIIPAIFHPLQPIDQPVRNRGFANNSDNSAHGFLLSLQYVWETNSRHLRGEVLGVSGNKDCAVHLRSSKDVGIHQLHRRPIPDVRRSGGNSSIDFDHFER
jgi:hypothetical protein